MRIIGDLPIYVAHGSADIVDHPALFDESEHAGAPPDYFNRDGQLWGNPLYRWPAHRAQRYRWWTERFRRAFELVDVTRVDHFRGFVAAWAVPGARRPPWRDTGDVVPDRRSSGLSSGSSARSRSSSRTSA